MANPLAVKFDAFVTFAAAVCVMSPPAVTVRLFEVIVPRTTALLSMMVTSVPSARTLPNEFVLLLRVTFPFKATKVPVPAMVRLPEPVSSMSPPVMSVRFPNVMASMIVISPVVLLPMVSRLAVMFPISVEVRPSVVELPAPPNSTPAPSVRISTCPAEVALTVPARFRLLAVRVIEPALE